MLVYRGAGGLQVLQGGSEGVWERREDLLAMEFPGDMPYRGQVSEDGGEGRYCGWALHGLCQEEVESGGGAVKSMSLRVR